jgi:hypothetical protein
MVVIKTIQTLSIIDVQSLIIDNSLKMKMKADWYLKLCQDILPKQKDLIEHKCG